MDTVAWPVTIAAQVEEAGYPRENHNSALAAPSKEDWVEGWARSLNIPSRITFLHLFAVLRSKVTYKLI